MTVILIGRYFRGKEAFVAFRAFIERCIHRGCIHIFTGGQIKGQPDTFILELHFQGVLSWRFEEHTKLYPVHIYSRTNRRKRHLYNTTITFKIQNLARLRN